MRRMRAESGNNPRISQTISEDSETDDNCDFYRNITIEPQRIDKLSLSRFADSSRRSEDEKDDEDEGRDKEFGKIRYMKKKDACSSYYMKRINVVETSTLEFDSIVSFYDLYGLSD